MVDYQDTILETQRSLGRLEGKLDAMMMLLTDHIKKDEIVWAKVSRLEKRIVWASGVAAALMFFITTSATGLLKMLRIL